MTTLLLTAIAGDIGQGVAAILKRAYPDWKLIGADIHDQHGGRRITDVCTRLPRAMDAEYPARLGQLVTEHGIDAILPLSEAELARCLEDGLAVCAGAPLLMANARVLEVGLDKLLTAQSLAEAGIAMPWTQLAMPGVIPPLPCFFKPRRGAGSKQAFSCRTEQDANYLAMRYPGGVFQELLEPDDRELTCAVYRTRDGRIAVLQLLRRLAGGLTGWARVVDDPAVKALCMRVAEVLDLRGSMNVQLRITDKGPRIFEINPRFSSTVLMRHEIGFQDVLWTVEEWRGETVTLVQPALSTEIVRTYGAAVFPPIESQGVA
jgi:carbamoyl-phosphate synthase large subunit